MYTSANYFVLAVWRGDIEKAKRYLSELEINQFGKTKQQHLYRGQMMIAWADGRWADAEQAAREWKDHLIIFNYAGDWIPDAISRSNYLLAIVLTEQSRLQEAELVLRKHLLEELKRFGSSRAMSVAELYGELAKVYLRAGRLEEALSLARQSCIIARKLKMGWGSFVGGLFECVRFQANAQFALRRFKQARTMYDQIKSEYGQDNPLGFDSFVRDDPNRLLLLILTGAEADSGAVVDGLIAHLSERLGPNHYRSAEAKAMKAALLARSGEPTAALPLFREAFAVISKRSQGAGEGDASLVRQRFAYLSEIYLDAIADVLAGKQTPALVEEAFRVAAEARVRRVGAAVSASASRSRITDPELAELARREQDAQRQIGALHKLLANATLRGGSNAVREQLRARVDGLRAARAAILKELEQRFPTYAENHQPEASESFLDSARSPHWRGAGELLLHRKARSHLRSAELRSHHPGRQRHIAE